MVAQILLTADAKAYLMDVEPHGITVGQREYGLAVIRRVVEVKYLLGYRMQGDKCLYFCLLAVDADIASAVGCCSDI